MVDYRTRVIQVRFTSEPDGDCMFQASRIRFAAVVLFPPEVKRQLATLEAATGRAVELARQIIQRDCYRPPNLDRPARTIQTKSSHGFHG
jgi:hypothetical protein